MKMPLFTDREKCSRLGVLLVAFSLLGASGLNAQPHGQVPPAGYIEDPIYAFQPPPNYPAAANGAYSPGNYQPPSVTPRGTTKTKVTKTVPSGSPGRTSGHNTGKVSVEAKMGQLAQNDERQDQRLQHLERDVSNLKAGSGSYVPASIRQSGHYISKPSPAAPANTSRLHTVREGETLWRIAAKYNTSVNAIRATNRIPGDTVAVGQTLMIPGDSSADTTTAVPSSQSSFSASVHIVKKGQTFDQIARSYKVSSDALARANPSAYPDKLLIGEKLTIPGRKAPAATTTAAVFRPGAPAAAKAGTHIVRPGQSLGAIAKSYGISTARLVAANKIKNPDLVEVGQVLVIPGGSTNATGNSVAVPPRMTSKPGTAPQLAANTRQTADTVPLPGAGMPMSRPAPVEPPVKPTPPAEFTPSAAAPAPVPAPARKAAMPVGSHRGVVAYRLERGDDIDSVANMFSTTSDKIRELNKLGPDAKMKEGDELVVPAMGPVSVVD